MLTPIIAPPSHLSAQTIDWALRVRNTARYMAMYLGKSQRRRAGVAASVATGTACPARVSKL